MGTPAPQPFGSDGETPVGQKHAPSGAFPSESIADGLLSSDRRRNSRRTLIGGRLVTVRLGSQDSGLALDLSETGMGLRAFPGLKVGSTTELGFELPDLQYRIELQAQVTWAERSGSRWSKGSGGRVGVRFLNLSATAQSQLNEWLSLKSASSTVADESATSVLRVSAAPPSEVHHSGNHASQNNAKDRSGSHPDAPVAEIRAWLRDGELSGVPALQWIAARSLSLSGATGAAIAVDDGQGMVCRASLGNAPDLGVRIQSESGLTGECIRTGQIVRCDDTEADSRVDPVLCRELNLRSALILPLHRDGRLCGVLEAFSDHPRAFSESTVSLLRGVSDIVVEVIIGMLPEPAVLPQVNPVASVPVLPQPAERSEVRLPAAPARRPAVPGAPVIQQRTASLVRTPVSQSSQSQSQNQIKTRTSVPPSAQPLSTGVPPKPLEPRPRRMVKAAALSESIPCDACGHANSRGKRVCEKCDVPLSVVENYVGAPTAEDVRAAQAAVIVADRLARVQSKPVKAAAAPRRRIKPVLWAGAVLAVISLGFGVWKGRQSASVPPKLPSPPAQQSAPSGQDATSRQDAAGGQPVEVAPPVVLAPISYQPASQAVPHSAVVTPSAAVQQAAVPQKSAAAPRLQASLQNQQGAQNQQDEVKWVRFPAAVPAPTAAVVPPSAASLPAAGDLLASLPRMAVVTNSPAFTPSHPPVPVTGGVSGGQLIHRVDPTYPELAKRMGKKGSVVIAGVVSRGGVMENLRVISGDPLLTGAAITAVRQWRFDPYRLSGNAVEAPTRVVVTFKD